MKAVSIPIIDRDDYQRLQAEFGPSAFPHGYEEMLSQTRAAVEAARGAGQSWCPQSIWFADFIWFCAAVGQLPDERLLWTYARQLHDEVSEKRPPELQ